jgi:hypothetical protein
MLLALMRRMEHANDETTERGNCEQNGLRTGSKPDHPTSPSLAARSACDFAPLGLERRTRSAGPQDGCASIRGVASPLDATATLAECGSAI